MVRNRRIGRGREAAKGPPAWMITFADLSTLLLTFFVLLVAMSTMDDKTLKTMFHNFNAHYGMMNFNEYVENFRPKEILIQGLHEDLKDSLIVRKAEDSSEEIVSANEETSLEKLGNSLVVENFKGGFKLVFGHRLLFPSGGAEIREEMKPVLKRIGSFLRNSDYQVYIDGHTDSVPIRDAQYPSNEELSLARAFNLMEYLVKQEKALPVSMALAGYGEVRPVDSNQTPAGRARNRRVEMIFKSQKYF